jgi:hypothetical protein
MATKKKSGTQPTLEATPKKKAAKDKAPAKETTREQVFKLLAKHPNGLTMPQIREKLELKKPVSLVKHECLADKPRMKREQHEDSRAMLYSLTAAGKKAIADGTVDSGAAPSSAGYTDKE